MHTHIGPAIILRHADFQESDRVVTVFSRDHGRIAGLARGVRKSVKRFAGHLDLFSLVELRYKSGRGDLFQFENAELIRAHMGIRQDLYRIAWAGYLCELVEKLFGEAEPHPELFDLLSDALLLLDKAPRLGEGTLRALELRFLADAGLQPELEQCGLCRISVESGRSFSFVVARGAVLCEQCYPNDPDALIPAETIGLLGYSQQLPLHKLVELRFTQKEARGARVLLNAFIRYHVGTSLRSTAFLNELEVVSEIAGEEER